MPVCHHGTSCPSAGLRANGRLRRLDLYFNLVVRAANARVGNSRIMSHRTSFASPLKAIASHCSTLPGMALRCQTVAPGLLFADV